MIKLKMKKVLSSLFSPLDITYFTCYNETKTEVSYEKQSYPYLY